MNRVKFEIFHNHEEVSKKILNKNFYKKLELTSKSVQFRDTFLKDLPVQSMSKVYIGFRARCAM